MTRHTSASLTVAACALSWGLVAIIVRRLEMPAMVIVFYRVLFAAVAIAMALVLARRAELLRTSNRAVLVLGLLLALHWTCFFAAIQETSVASAVLITYSSPVLVAILAPAVLGEHVPALSVAALVLSLAGIALIALSGEGGDVRATGVVLALGAAATSALLFVGFKRFAADVAPVTVVLYETAVAALVLSPAAIAGGYALGIEAVGYLIVLGVVLTGLVIVVFVAALRDVPATTAGIIAYMEPVSAAALAALLLGEIPSAPVIAGGVAIVASGAAVALRAPAAHTSTAAAPESP